MRALQIFRRCVGLDAPTAVCRGIQPRASLPARRRDTPEIHPESFRGERGHRALQITALFIAFSVHAGQVVRDGTVGPAGALPGPDFLIPDADGQTRGNNLFHSFSQFNLDAGESATFTGPESIRNVLARVTGGNASMIDGALNCEIPGANFFFINPFGVLFGQNAQVNVSGSFAVTTADYVKLADGGRFDARNPANDILTAAPVSAFGFLGPTAAPITLDGSTDPDEANFFFFEDFKSIWLVGGDIHHQGAYLISFGGEIVMVSVASAGELGVDLDNQRFDVDTSPFATLGSISLNNATAFVEIVPGGQVVMEADRISFENLAGISASGDVFVRARSQISLNQASVATFAVEDVDGGNLIMTAPSVRLENSNLAAITFGDGRGGDLIITADEFSLLSGGNVSVETASSGAGGNLFLTAHRVLIAGLSDGSTSPFLTSSGVFGPPGNINVQADIIELRNGGQITSDAFGGDFVGGEIRVSANQLILDDQQLSGNTRISSRSFDQAGGAGNIVLDVNHLEVLNGAQITTTTFNDGPAGNILISAHDAFIAGNSSIQSAAVQQNGIAGSVTLSLTGSLLLHDGGLLSVSAFQNAGGDVTVTAGDSIRLVNGQINAEAFLDGGNVTLMAPRLVYLLDSQITAKSIEGNGGNITIDPVFVVLNNSLLQASAIIGNGGNINIISDFFLSSASIIDASSEFGLQGNVNITSPNADLAGNFVGLDEDPLDAESRLRPHCAVRLPTGVSSFIITGRGGVPMEPDGLLPELPGR